MVQSKYNLGLKPILRVGQDLGAEWGAQRGSLGCGSHTLALEESRPPQTDGGPGLQREKLCCDQHFPGGVCGQWFEREHLVPTLFQPVPGTFISLVIGSSHSAAHSLYRKTLELRMVKRPAQGHTVVEQELYPRLSACSL